MISTITIHVVAIALAHLAPVSWAPQRQTLITVSGEGDTHIVPGMSAHQCAEAKSLALTGETVEGYAAADKALADAQENARAAWAKAHPPRQPATDQERALVREQKKINEADGMILSGCGGCAYNVTSDGLIQDEDPYNNGMTFGTSYSPDQGEYTVWQHGRDIIKNKTDVKTAVCLDGAEAK